MSRKFSKQILAIQSKDIKIDEIQSIITDEKGEYATMYGEAVVSEGVYKWTIKSYQLLTRKKNHVLELLKIQRKIYKYTGIMVIGINVVIN